MQPIIFRDRIDAANKLAEELKQQLMKPEHRDSSSIVVLSIPRGGVVIGDVVADKLNVKLDVVVSRKIGAPIDPEVAIGAVMPDGTYFLNEDIILTLNVPQNYIDTQVNEQLKEIERRLISFRGSKEYDRELTGKTVVLVDDGIATGATMLSAAQWLKTKQNCQELIIAVPVAPRDTVDRLKQIVGNNDKVIVLYSPESFTAVGQFYADFGQVSDSQVKKIMKKHGYKIKSD
ncbi:MAG TPA: phosphoribosyltransferase family protein [Methylomirabilota bacterium]|nr:phosphoribosyltransferase family protein [Methylomirabilota bacterium]